MTKIIVEISSSHNGDLELAKALIRVAAENGADILKFQDWRASNVPDSDPDKQRYTRYEFKDEWYPILIDFCKEQNVEFLTTVFNQDRVKFLANQGLKKIKLASISLTNTELIMEAGLHFEEVIISTAMHSKEEISELIDLLASNCQKFTIMHCVANYPTLAKDANLNRITELKDMIGDQAYGSVGYSDHSVSDYVPKIALAMDIKYLEKHFTLSRYLPQIPHQMYEGGPLITTHQIAIEPEELYELSEWRDWVINTQKGSQLNEIENKIKSRYLNRYGH